MKAQGRLPDTKGSVSQEQDEMKSAECSETGRRLEMPAALGDEEDFGDLGGAGGVRECRHCIELVFYKSGHEGEGRDEEDDMSQGRA